MFVFLVFFGLIKVCICCDGFIPKNPNLKQIDGDLVLVNWIEAVREIHRLDILGIKLTYWPKEKPKDKKTIVANDHDINFDFANVKKDVIFSYQLDIHIRSKCVIKFEIKFENLKKILISECDRWMASNVIGFRTNDLRGEYFNWNPDVKNPVASFELKPVIWILTLVCLGVGAIFVLAIVVLFLAHLYQWFTKCGKFLKP